MRWGWMGGGMLVVAGIALTALMVKPHSGLRPGDEVIVKGSGGVRGVVLDVGGTIQGRPAVRLRLDNGPAAKVRFEEMQWPIDELEQAQPTQSALGR